MTFDSTIQSADVTDTVGTSTVTPTLAAPSDRLIAVLARMTDNGYVQLAKAQARVYVATLRSVEKNKHAVFEQDDAENIIATIEFDHDEKGNNVLAMRYTLMYGTTNGSTVKRLKKAVSSGVAADVSEALEKGLGKPPVEDTDEPKASGYLVQGNGQRIALTDVQYRAVLLIIKG